MSKSEPAKFAVAGVDRPQLAQVAIAGVNTLQLRQAALGIAGNFSTSMLPALPDVLRRPERIGADRLGDQAAMHAWKRCIWFCDYTYLVKPCSSDSVEWRERFKTGFDRAHRALPLWLDSGAWRRHTGEAPRWDSLERYCQAIELCGPDGYMAYDTVGNARASREGYDRMVARGFSPVPVWQVRELWDNRASTLVRDPYGQVTEAIRTAIANARLAASDPDLRYYCERSPLVALGGLARGPCPREVRAIYIRELTRAYPDHQFWALAQASHVVVNGLGQHGLLDRVWTDGAWWIHHARTDSFAILEKGLLKPVRLEGRARTFFSLWELMAANLRSISSAYTGLWTFPPPDPIPDLRNPDGLRDMKRRLRPIQQDLLALLPPPNQEEEEESA